MREVHRVIGEMVDINDTNSLAPDKVSVEVLIIVEPVAVGLLLIPLDSADRIPGIVSMEMRVALNSSCKGFVILEVPSNYSNR